MTTEDDFQSALDANPEDWQTRLVFADWLQERGDLRAGGYRALGVGNHRTDTTGTGGVLTAFHWWSRDWVNREYRGHKAIFTPVSLVDDWFSLLDGGVADHEQKRDYTTRRAAEDAAALAFAKLPADRQRELLAATEAARQSPGRKTKRPRGRRKK